MILSGPVYKNYMEHNAKKLKGKKKDPGFGVCKGGCIFSNSLASLISHSSVFGNASHNKKQIKGGKGRQATFEATMESPPHNKKVCLGYNSALP